MTSTDDNDDTIQELQLYMSQMKRFAKFPSKHSVQDWPNKQPNAHMMQALIYCDELPIFSGTFSLQNRILHATDQQAKYKRRRNDFKSVLHWGQRKLLLSGLFYCYLQFF